MKISAIICTHNRSQLLRKAVLSLIKQTISPEDYEIIVVDNASSDDTQEIVLDLMERAANLRYVYEPELGLSNARNCGVEEAKGEIVAFMDDDALADKGWLANHLLAYQEDEDVVAVGGKIQLLWATSTKPKWLPAQLEGFLTALDLGPTPRVMRYPKYPYGCNMSVRTDVVKKVGGFSTNLGRKGQALASNEEKEFFHRLNLLNMKIIYNPGAVVYHIVLPERVSAKFFIKRSYAQGFSDILLQSLRSQGDTFYWLHQSMLGGKRCARAVIKVLFYLLTKKPALSFLAATSFFHNLGYMLGAIKTGIVQKWGKAR